jgi:hypothetical protein
LQLKQATPEFSDHMVTVSALKSQAAKFRNTVWLLKLLWNKKMYGNQVRLLLKVGLLSRIDKLKSKDIYGVVRVIHEHQVSHGILFDLLGVQFARSQRERDDASANLFDRQATIVSVLTQHPQLDPQTLIKTATNIFLQATQAFFYLYKDGSYLDKV